MNYHSHQSIEAVLRKQCYHKNAIFIFNEAHFDGFQTVLIIVSIDCCSVVATQPTIWMPEKDNYIWIRWFLPFNETTNPVEGQAEAAAAAAAADVLY